MRQTDFINKTLDKTKEKLAPDYRSTKAGKDAYRKTMAAVQANVVKLKKRKEDAELNEYKRFYPGIKGIIAKQTRRLQEILNDIGLLDQTDELDPEMLNKFISTLGLLVQQVSQLQQPTMKETYTGPERRKGNRTNSKSAVNRPGSGEYIRRGRRVDDSVERGRRRLTRTYALNQSR